MNRVHEGIATSDFPVPKTVEPVTLCRESHLPAVSGGCKETYVEYFAVGTAPEKSCTLHKPAPETEKKTIYSDLLSRLKKKAKSESESESESESGSESESASETENKSNIETESESESESGSRADSESAGNISPEKSPTLADDHPETDPTSDILPQSEIGDTLPQNNSDSAPAQNNTDNAPAQNNTGQPDTSSFDDLMNRLTGSSTGSSVNPGNTYPW